MDSTNVGDFSSVIEKMKWEEPMIFTQMCVNMLKYIAPDMPNEATQRLLDIKQFYAQAAGGSGSIPSKVGKSGGDGSLFSSVGGSFGDGNICELSICHILIKYLENCKYYFFGFRFLPDTLGSVTFVEARKSCHKFQYVMSEKLDIGLVSFLAIKINICIIM